MRFHVVSLPHTQTTREYSACAFTEKVRKFCNMMAARGHTVFLYAGDQNEAQCSVLVPLFTEAQRAVSAGSGHYTEASFDATAPHWQVFNSGAAAAIRTNAADGDFVCLIGGTAQQPIAAALADLRVMIVEFGIGYHGTFAPYRVFESAVWQHIVYGAERRSSDIDGRWFDAVIPNSFEPEAFPAPERPTRNYYLFMGRMVDRKGCDIAIATCEALHAKLVLAGPGTPPQLSDYRGVVGPAERAQLMGNAKAVFVPTKYIEPFGGVAVEAMLCGTPVITTDWGGFTETVIHGVTGFRCHTLGEFMHAARAVEDLDRGLIQRYAQGKYSTAAVGRQYESYFLRLATLWGKGWYDRSATL